jgi:prefoldin subunit 5
MSTMDIEKRSLEAHVDLCAERYKNLDNKLDSLEKRMDKFETHLVDIKDSLTQTGTDSNKTIITIGTAVFTALLTGFVTLLLHFATK